MNRLKILTVDTSSQVCGVALCEDETLIAQSCLNIRSTHSQTLLEQIDMLLTRVGWLPADLHLLAVVTGPGAFTGLRIGLGTIKGLAQILKLPVVTVSSLQAVAMNLALTTEPVCVLLDARKQEVYTQTFDCSAPVPVALNDAQVISPEKLMADIDGSVVVAGDGVPSYGDLIEQTLGVRVRLAPACAHPVHPVRVAWLALQRYHQGGALTPENVLPFYIRPADAELPGAKI